MGIFSIYRHHLANAAHREYLAKAKAERKAAKPKRVIAGRRVSAEQWAEYEARWRPLVESWREVMAWMYERNLAKAQEEGNESEIARNTAELAKMRAEITPVELAVHAERNGGISLRPPRGYDAFHGH